VPKSGKNSTGEKKLFATTLEFSRKKTPYFHMEDNAKVF